MSTLEGGAKNERSLNDPQTANPSDLPTFMILTKPREGRSPEHRQGTGHAHEHYERSKPLDGACQESPIKMHFRGQNRPLKRCTPTLN